MWAASDGCISHTQICSLLHIKHPQNISVTADGCGTDHKTYPSLITAVSLSCVRSVIKRDLSLDMSHEQGICYLSRNPQPPHSTPQPQIMSRASDGGTQRQRVAVHFYVHRVTFCDDSTDIYKVHCYSSQQAFWLGHRQSIVLRYCRTALGLCTTVCELKIKGSLINWSRCSHTTNILTGRTLFAPLWVHPSQRIVRRKYQSIY